MKWLGLWIFVFGSLGADEGDLVDLFDETTPMFVSLGCNCEVSLQLRDNQLRKCAFPFDWIFMFNQDKFNDLLDDDFACFLDKDYLMQYPILANGDQAVNTLYAIEFTHDDLPLEDWEGIKVQSTLAKYERRIHRFRQLRHYPGKVIFLYHPYHPQADGISDYQREWWSGSPKKAEIEQVRALKSTLDRYFPELDFILVLVNHVTEWVLLTEEISGVREFKMRWFDRDADYRAMFKTLKESA